MKVIKKTGLVPVRSNRDGSVFGVVPAEARRMKAASLVEFVTEIPDDIEAYDIADVVETPEVKAETAADEAVEIPDDWESMHHLQKVKLARSLPGGESVKTLAEAVAVIGEEIARRAAPV